MRANVYEQRLSDVITGAIAMILGFCGVFLPFPITKVITDALPEYTETALYLGLIVGGIAVIWGMHSKRIEGPGYMVAGLFLTTAFFLAYAVAVLIQAWPISIVAATPYLILSIANLFRIYEVSRGARVARAAVFKKV